MNKILLQHDNAQLHMSIRTREAITSFGWTMMPHPPYSADLAHSDYHLFGVIKDAVRGKYCGNDEEVKIVAKSCLGKYPPEFYKTGIHALI